MNCLNCLVSLFIVYKVCFKSLIYNNDISKMWFQQRNYVVNQRTLTFFSQPSTLEYYPSKLSPKVVLIDILMLCLCPD